jgi:hypothetical protein
MTAQPKTSERKTSQAVPSQAAPAEAADAGPARPPLSEAARRALAEAAERRRSAEEKLRELARVREINGRGGLDPVRYSDWEVKGIASDFS